MSARDRYAQLFQKIAEKAFSLDSFNALCALLRVHGIEDAGWDTLAESRATIDDFNWILAKGVEEKKGDATARRIRLLMYCHAVEMTPPLEIMVNLLRCVRGERYKMFPLAHLGHYQNAKKNGKRKWVPPTAKQKIRFTKELAVQVGMTDLGEAFDAIFNERIRNAFFHSDYVLTAEHFRARAAQPFQISVTELDGLIDECFAFYSAFLYMHRFWLKDLARGDRFHRLPNYEVLEMLVSEEDGVHGWKMHFSNGQHAFYTRTSSGVDGLNLMINPNGEFDLNVGQIDALVPVWKINGVPVADYNSTGS